MQRVKVQLLHGLLRGLPLIQRHMRRVKVQRQHGLQVIQRLQLGQQLG